MANVIFSKVTRNEETCFTLEADGKFIFTVTFYEKPYYRVIVKLMSGYTALFHPTILPIHFEEEIFRNMIRNETGTVCFHDSSSSVQFLYLNRRLIIDYPDEDGLEINRKTIEIPVNSAGYKKETQVSTRVDSSAYTDEIVYSFLENGTNIVEIKYETKTTDLCIPFYSFRIALGRDLDFIKILDDFLTSIVGGKEPRLLMLKDATVSPNQQNIIRFLYDWDQRLNITYFKNGEAGDGIEISGPFISSNVINNSRYYMEPKK